ncbi:hypothetical protein SADUNF_Sadunf02G0051900 [Salix dunnii]|uniref:Anamorsin N-terminal domain-containing protein n=1 Tax=Salix dunnii TaxID=1413687 RepID=A0A835N687_9ROSI|nr:hypothetical protein SADUNF_Sadunf02G0051900 [Salix dunnii]
MGEGAGLGEDGVLDWGQLKGGRIGEGSGWCHTSNVAAPSHTLDSRWFSFVCGCNLLPELLAIKHGLQLAVERVIDARSLCNSDSKDTKSMMQRSVLALTDQTLISISRVVNAAREDANDGVEQCDPQVITQASSLSKLPAEPSSVDTAVSICDSLEFPGDLLLKEILRVLKPGGTILIYNSLQSVIGETDEAISGLQRKLLLAGFLEVEALRPKSIGLSDAICSFGVKAKKPSWNIGSSFAIKKSIKSSVKVQIDDDSDLIVEDSLLTEEDLKKPQPPPEEKVKLGLTTDQLNNPQSACGNVLIHGSLDESDLMTNGRE